MSLSGAVSFIKSVVLFIEQRIERYQIIIEGNEPEKLISRAMNAGIYLERPRIMDEITVEIICPACDFDVLKKLAGSKYQISVKEKYGLLPAMQNIVRRKGLIAGGVAAIVILFMQQIYISEVDIEGNYLINEDEVRKVAEKYGLKEGMRKDRVDGEQLITALFGEFDDITWIGIDYQGAYAKIEIIEGKKVRAETDNIIHDIVAKKSGYITEIIAKNGYPLIKEGDYVQEGQVLISSQVPVNNLTYDESRNDTYRFVEAEGQVKANVIYKLSLKFPKNDYGTYTEEELKNEADTGIKEFLRKNVPDYIELINKDLKFADEENIIECIVTLEVSENISMKKENEIAES